MGRSTGAFIYFLTWASLTLILWIKGIFFPVWGVECLWFIPLGPLSAFLFPGRLTSVDDISRLPCSLASSWFWLLGAFTGDKRKGGKKYQGIYLPQDSCIHHRNIKAHVRWLSRLSLCSRTNNRSLSLLSYVSRRDNCTSLLPVLVVSLYPALTL